MIHRVHVELAFELGVRYGSRFTSLPLHIRWLQHHWLNMTSFLQCICFYTLVKSQLGILVLVSFWVLHSVPLICAFLTSIKSHWSHCVDSCTYRVCLNNEWNGFSHVFSSIKSVDQFGENQHIFSRLCLLIYECGMSLQLSMSWFLSTAFYHVQDVHPSLLDLYLNILFSLQQL